MQKPYSQAAENNKGPILRILKSVFAPSRLVLEIGSGTGQHAVHMAEYLPHLQWQPSDLVSNHAGIRYWLDDYVHGNMRDLIELDVSKDQWPLGFDAVFSANTAHIMAWNVTLTMLEQVSQRLPQGGVFALYGPFNYGGAYTSASNEAFDHWLKQQNPEQGIRDFERVNEIVSSNNVSLVHDHAMPANNRLLVWKKGEVRRLNTRAC